MTRLFLLLALALTALTSCAPTLTPRPAPVLTVRQLDARRALVQLDPAPAAARWEVRPSAECGDVDGPASASGPWPAPAPVLEVPARPGDLVTVWAVVDGVSVRAADCPV